MKKVLDSHEARTSVLNSTLSFESLYDASFVVRRQSSTSVKATFLTHKGMRYKAEQLDRASCEGLWKWTSSALQGQDGRLLR